MTDQEQLIADRAVSLQAAARVFTKVIAELIYRDSHSWSERPCGTCQAITSIIGADFGCDRYRKERTAQRKTKDA